MSIPKHALLSAIGLLFVAVSFAASGPRSIPDRIEILDWSDPERALRSIQTIEPAKDGLAGDIPMLEVQGEVYADMHHRAEVDETIATLHAIAARGSRAADLAEHFVRAYSQFELGEYAAAGAELSTSDIQDIRLPTEQYRFLILRGNSLRLQQQTEAALPILEQAYALAPKGSLAEDALAREVEAWSRAGATKEAQAAAGEYAGAFPRGAHAEQMRRLIGP